MATAESIRKGQAQVEKRSRVLERLVIEYVPVDSIHPNNYNPNRQTDKDFELLRRSIREDGFTQPVIVHKDSRQIVDGEHRWRAARAENYKTLPVVLVDMTLEQMRISTLRHNRARGSEDVDLSAQILKDLRALGALDWAADSLMLDDALLQKLISDVPVAAQLANEEYTEAWIPVKAANTAAEAEAKAEHGKTFDTTPSAQEAQSLFRERLAEAKDDIERSLVAQAAKDEFHVTVSFSGDDADLVREVLGKSPAARLLELIHKELA